MTEAEIMALESMFPDEFRVTHAKEGELTRCEILLKPKTAGVEKLQFVQAVLQFTIPPTYPDVPPEIHVANARGLDGAGLCAHVAKGAAHEDNVGLEMLWTLIDMAQDWMEQANKPSGDCAICLCDFDDDGVDDVARTQCFHYFHLGCLVDWAARKTLEHEHSIKERESHRDQRSLPGTASASSDNVATQGNVTARVGCPNCMVPFDLSFLESMSELLEPRLQQLREEEEKKSGGGAVEKEQQGSLVTRQVDGIVLATYSRDVSASDDDGEGEGNGNGNGNGGENGVQGARAQEQQQQQDGDDNNGNDNDDNDNDDDDHGSGSSEDGHRRVVVVEEGSTAMQDGTTGESGRKGKNKRGSRRRKGLNPHTNPVLDPERPTLIVKNLNPDLQMKNAWLKEAFADYKCERARVMYKAGKRYNYAVLEFQTLDGVVAARDHWHNKELHGHTLHCETGDQCMGLVNRDVKLGPGNLNHIHREEMAKAAAEQEAKEQARALERQKKLEMEMEAANQTGQGHANETREGLLADQAEARAAARSRGAPAQAKSLRGKGSARGGRVQKSR